MASFARELKESVGTDWRVQGPYQWATVAAIHIGGTFGTLDVYLDSNASSPGATLALGIPFLNGYAPTIGDTVLVGRMAGAAKTQRIILGPLEQVGSGINQAGEGFFTDVTVSGLTGATAGYRMVGSTDFGPPLTGTFQTHDVIYDLTTFGRWICTAGGSPGTWKGLEGAVTSPKAPTIVVNTTGTTSWWYKVVAEGKNGSTFYDAIPSAAVKITNGAATPNNTVNWTAPLGVDASRVSYVVLRSTDGVTYSRIAFTAVGVLTFTDNNASASAYTASTTNPGAGKVIGDQLYRTRVRLTTNQSVAFNPGNVKILFQTVDYDPSSSWDATNHVYVIQVSGFYLVAHAQSYNFGAQTGFFESGVSVNGAAPLPNSGCAAQIDNNNSWMQGNSASPIIYFNAGEQISIITAPQMTVGAATLVGDGSAHATHATFEYRGS